MLYTISQILVTSSSIVFAVSLFLNSKKNLLFLQIFSSSLFALHYFFLEAYLGGLISLIDCIRIVTFYVIDKRNGTNLNKQISCVIFIVLGLIGSMFTWSGWYSIFPIICLITVNLSLTLNNLICLKIGFSISQASTILYMFFIASYFGLATQVAVFIVSLIATYLEVKNKNKPIIY